MCLLIRIHLIFQLLHQKGNGRRVVVSSFNPDVCLALKLKQSTYPVYFISRGGVNPKGNMDHPQALDPRHESGVAATMWAHQLCLNGVVLFGACLGAGGVDKESAIHLVRLLAHLNLAAISYGHGVSSGEYRQFAASIGLTGICIDNAVQLALTENFNIS